MNFRELSIDIKFLEILSNSLYYRFVSKDMHAMLSKRRHANNVSHNGMDK